MHEGGTAVVIEGPAFSTRAESSLHRAWGADLVSMTMLPEAKLAREAGICYAALACVTDYDVWRESDADVTAQMILDNLLLTVENARRAVALAIEQPPRRAELRLRLRPARRARDVAPPRAAGDAAEAGPDHRRTPRREATRAMAASKTMKSERCATPSISSGGCATRRRYGHLLAPHRRYAAYGLAQLEPPLFEQSQWWLAEGDGETALLMHSRGGLGRALLALGDEIGLYALLSLHPGPGLLLRDRSSSSTCR